MAPRWGPDGRVYVCNNGGLKWSVIDGFVRAVGAADQALIGSIQAVNLRTGVVETLYDSCQGEPLKAPNDLIFDAHGGFYFTDLGKRGPRWMDRGAVYYARPDGSAITEILQPLDTPNGIGLSPDGTRLYVAETLSAKVRYWDLTGPGQVQPPTADPFQVGHILYGFSGYERLDSLAVDSEGNVVVATLGTGCITAITPTGTVRAVIPVPEFDPMVTNICFGGPDLRTAFITSSGLGRLYAVEWHCPGLPLAHMG